MALGLPTASNKQVATVCKNSYQIPLFRRRKSAMMNTQKRRTTQAKEERGGAEEHTYFHTRRT